MWVLVLTVQDCIKVVRVSCECLYWLFRIVLRWWELHVSALIDCSVLYWGGENFMWVLVLTVQDCIKVLTVSCECFIQSWTINTSTHMKLSPPKYKPEQSIQALTWNSHHLNTILNSQYKHSHETLTTLIRISSECLYWLFRIVLRCWKFHVSACIDYSGWY
jgi:hypothetical protein